MAYQHHERNTDDKFYCSNGLQCIEWSWVCDGRKDCSDGSDETEELCAIYEYGTNMTTDCGRVNVKNHVLINKGEKSLIGTAPWSVGIYAFSRSSTNPSGFHMCDGSIILPNVVISDASGLSIQPTLSTKLSVKNGYLKVAVGKYNKFIISKIDNELIKNMINVEAVYLKEGYDGFADGYNADNIMIVVLANKISFSNDVAPVCIDWNSIYSVQNGDIGKMFVWGELVYFWTQNPVKLERFFPFIDRITCRKMHTTGVPIVNFDKFCVNYKMGQGTGFTDRGAGISFLHSNSYFLTGVLSFRDQLRNSTLTGFTDIKFYVQWIRRILNKHFRENSCVLPIVEGVLYRYEGSNEILSHGILVNLHATIIETCEPGYHKAYPIGFRFCQGKGKWLTNSGKLCYKMCPPLESDSLDIKCSHNGKYANCSNVSIPDTIATLLCKPLYTAPNGQEETPIELNCQANGMWNEPLHKCNPNCGKVSIINHVLINNGEKALIGTAPWNVGVYKINEMDSNYDLICGGSIIASKLVISAAHCFWKKGLLSKRISVTDGLYKIAVGKYDGNFTIIDNEFTQIMNVEMIHLNEGYYGQTGFHAEDIAIIVLKNRVSFSNGVSPVCIDWNGKYNVANGNQGKIVGWGKTEKGVSSPILLESSLPYIDHSTCRNMYTNGFESFVTADKFCAGSELGQGVDKGDSGAGLCFLHSDSYYLTGVVSIKDPSTNNSIAVFTEVKYHIKWIRGLFNSLN